jgi:hypothetical protein
MFMVNNGNYEFVTSQAAQINGMQGGEMYTGELAVAKEAPVGIYSYSADFELVNWAVLGGASSSNHSSCFI